MADDWEADYDDEPPKVAATSKVPVKSKGKWDDEEEEEDTKEEWDADSDSETKEKKPAPAPTPVSTPAKPKPAPAQAKTVKASPAAKPVDASFEEKQRQKAAVEASDLQNALELFGEQPPVKNNTTSSQAPKTPQTPLDFQKMSSDILKQLVKFEKQPEYTAFLERLLKELFANQSSTFIKKASVILTTVQKQAEEREKAAKLAAAPKQNLKKLQLAGGASKKATNSLRSAIENSDDIYGDDGFDDEDEDEEYM